MKIIHLCQAHKLPFGINASQNYLNECLQSQLTIATFISQNKSTPVLLEGLTENSSSYKGEMARVARIFFPKGIPDNIEQLNELQKNFLYQEGAVRSLHYLGILNIYRSIHPEISKIVDEAITKGDFQKIFKDREVEAISCIKETILEENPEQIILVYGGGHNFSSYCKENGYEYERVETTRATSQLDNELLSTKRHSEIPFFKSGHDVQQSNKLLVSNINRNTGHTHFTVADKKLGREWAGAVEENPNLLILNEKIIDCPNIIDNRLARAKLHIKHQDYSKALEDYQYIQDKYPKNIESKMGIQQCEQQIADMNEFHFERPRF